MLFGALAGGKHERAERVQIAQELDETHFDAHRRDVAAIRPNLAAIPVGDGDTLRVDCRINVSYFSGVTKALETNYPPLR